VWFEEPVPMIETAASIMAEADLFLLVGTSLQVYPAAGLIHYVADEVPKYIIDKKIPDTGGRVKNIIPIELSATEGMLELSKRLL
jgi:NAD-dependent deacetylase